MKTATFVKNGKGFNGDAKVYRLSEPLEGYDGEDYSLVVVSATTLPMGLGVETYIFPANEDGTVSNWGELPGSIKGTLDHAVALAEAGYEVAK